MKPFLRPALRSFFLLAVSASIGLAATPTLTVQVDPTEASVGDTLTLTVTAQNGTLGKVLLPQVDGLQVMPDIRTTKTFSFSGGNYSTTTAETVHVMATRSGDFTIPAFDVLLQEGGTLRSKELQIHVVDNGNAATPPPPVAPASTNLAITPAGPAILPPPASANPPAQPATPADGNPVTMIPRDKDGGPAKVFMLIAPDTTDAYIGQAVPLRIDFYIRMAVNADQNSLPTIKGSDFLMNNFSVRGHANLVVLEGEQYECDTWLTAIAAPKAGDFPLATERDTYWVQSVTSNSFDPFGFNRHANLAHEFITSNQFTMHVHPLPTEGMSDHFTGAIGQFKVEGEAQPLTVAMGEPVTLSYSVVGEGNFDYVRCPVLPDDPAWKTYVPSAKTSFKDESHTHAIKLFEQAVIPQKNGIVPLPLATFSYFDPATKQYVTIPINLPGITVTGTVPVAVPPALAAESSPVTTAAAPAGDFLPNRLEFGSLQTSLAPVYRQPWFWAVQGGLMLLPLIGVLLLIVRQWKLSGQESAESLLRRHSVRQEQDAMTDAVTRDDAVAFFIAARHAMQLQLGAQWSIQPEAITLGEIHHRDPPLAESLTPFFRQADEVIYSGRASTHLDLAQWDRDVRELLQLQPA